jgi:REP element-mobilizing transposase RayT
MRYFITFACYGAHLHGDESGSVDRHHNVPGSRLAEANPERVAVKRLQMDQAPYLLDRHRRATVLDALREVCLHCGWSLWAAHVRTNHVHAVVEAEVRPEKIMHAFKSYASRNLNRLGIDELGRKRWARHGSTRWLWKDGGCRESHPLRSLGARRTHGSSPGRVGVAYRSFTVAAQQLYSVAC